MLVEHLKNKKIILTGATGFVGRYFLKTLEPFIKQYNIKISCVVRASSKRGLLPNFVNIYEADLHTGSGLSLALKGQDVVIHLAATLFGSSWKDYFSNVHIAKVLGQAISEESNIHKVLYVSSLAATGPSGANFIVDDNTIPNPISAYGWSKYLAEEVLFKYCQKSLVVLRPPMIYGEGDTGFLPFFQAVNKRIIVSPGFGRNFPVSIMHVHDVVLAMLCTLQEKSYGVYHCNDGYIPRIFDKSHTMQGIGEIIASILQKRAICIKMPLWIMGITAVISTLWGRYFLGSNKRKPSWNVDKYRESRAYGFVCDGQRIQDELGFKPQILLRDGLKQTIEDYKQRGWL